MATKRFVANLHAETFERWEGEMDERGYSSRSQFVRAMVEAGLKKFEAAAEPTESEVEIRESRDEWRAKARRRETRIAELEDRLDRTEYGRVTEFVSDHPEGVAFEEIAGTLEREAATRANRYLDSLLGESLTYDEQTDTYRPMDAAGDGSDPTDGVTLTLAPGALAAVESDGSYTFDTDAGVRVAVHRDDRTRGRVTTLSDGRDGVMVRLSSSALASLRDRGAVDVSDVDGDRDGVRTVTVVRGGSDASGEVSGLPRTTAATTGGEGA